jgi:hypothetical protein
MHIVWQPFAQPVQRPAAHRSLAAHVIEQAETWPQQDQEELAEYAREIQARRTGVYVMSDEERAAVRARSPVGAKYDARVNRESAYEILGRRNAAGSGVGNAGQPWPFGVQEAGMALVAGLAWATTPARIRRQNAFGFGPIVEVAVLFAGIFVTMAPALLLLNANAKGFGLTEPWQFFWSAGALSSFLDNAPTYLTFAATACGLEGVALEGRYLAQYLALGPKAAETLAAIATGAVFMGANTYIGNGPNFMVKAIAEAGGVRMPSFFGYMAYSCSVLIPLFVLVTFVSF